MGKQRISIQSPYENQNKVTDFKSVASIHLASPKNFLISHRFQYYWINKHRANLNDKLNFNLSVCPPDSADESMDKKINSFERWIGGKSFISVYVNYGRFREFHTKLYGDLRRFHMSSIRKLMETLHTDSNVYETHISNFFKRAHMGIAKYIESFECFQMPSNSLFDPAWLCFGTFHAFVDWSELCKFLFRIPRGLFEWSWDSQHLQSVVFWKLLQVPNSHLKALI